MISSGDNYEIALEEELKRVNELDNLAINLLEECERQANALATVRTRLNVLIRDKEHTEVHVEVGEIQDVLKVCTCTFGPGLPHCLTKSIKEKNVTVHEKRDLPLHFIVFDFLTILHSPIFSV